MGVQAHQVGTIMTTGEREVVHQDDDPGSFIVSAKGRICAARSRQCFGSFVLRRDGMNSNSRPWQLVSGTGRMTALQGPSHPA